MACSAEDLCRTSVARVCGARGFPREYFINENAKTRRVFIRSMCKTRYIFYLFYFFITTHTQPHALPRSRDERCFPRDNKSTIVPVKNEIVLRQKPCNNMHRHTDDPRVRNEKETFAS